MRSNWAYETCKCCTREQRIAWLVPDELWNSVVIDYFKQKALCLECFLRMADDRDITVSKDAVTILGLITRDMIVHRYGVRSINVVELVKMVEKVISWTGIVRSEAVAIAALTIEYNKPHHGFWNNNT